MYELNCISRSSDPHPHHWTSQGLNTGSSCDALLAMTTASANGIRPRRVSASRSGLVSYWQELITSAAMTLSKTSTFGVHQHHYAGLLHNTTYSSTPVIIRQCKRLSLIAVVDVRRRRKKRSFMDNGSLVLASTASESELRREARARDACLYRRSEQGRIDLGISGLSFLRAKCLCCIVDPSSG